jgi:formylglycine-generating enzyme required for sulfatase activity
MKKRELIILVVSVLLSVANVASATVVQGINIDFVAIGDAGNAGDTRGAASPSGAGSVAYGYSIGKYEITNGQWDTFVSAAGAPTGNPNYAYDESTHWTGTDVPTNEVSWYEAAQFCNYLTTGDKSQGAYQWSGNDTNPGDFTGIDRDSAISTHGTVYVIPTEDEWYKAAYYTGSGYSTYANGTDTAPVAGVDTNYNSAIGQPWEVGNGTIEQNGTFDMMGNVFEWNETLIGSDRGFRGGSYGYYGYGYDYYALRSSNRFDYDPRSERDDIGFRVASVPEPCTLSLLGIGGLMLIRRNKR